MDEKTNDEELTHEERLKRVSFQGRVAIDFSESEDEATEQSVNDRIMAQFRARIALEEAAENEPGDDTSTTAS